VKENSIEEDIKKLEEEIKRVNKINNLTGTYVPIDMLEHILSDYKRVLEINEVLQKENEELKEYIAITPNLDEMTATKYRNIQQNAYIQGMAEEQQKAEQIIYENYIPIQKVKDKIEHYQKLQDNYIEKYDEINEGLQAMINALQELLEGRK
jgi:hypothetical protein